MNLSVLDIPRAYTAIAEWMACMLFALNFRPMHDPVWWQRHGLMLLVFFGIFLVMWLLEHRGAAAEPVLIITWHKLVTAIIICLCVFAISNLSFYAQNTPFSSSYTSEIMTIRTLVD